MSNHFKEIFEDGNKAMVERWNQDRELRREELELQRRKFELEEKERQANHTMMMALAQALLKKFGE